MRWLSLFFLALGLAGMSHAQPQHLSRMPEYVALVNGSRLFATNPKQGLEDSVKALNALHARLGPDAPQLVEPLIMVSSMFREVDQDERSIIYAEHALRLAMKASGPQSGHVALSCQNIGAALLQLNKATEALPYLQRASAIYEADPKLRPSQAYIKVSIGGAYELLGQYALAEATILEGRNLAVEHRNRMPPGQFEMFVSRANSTLGGLYVTMGDYERAYAVQKQNLADSRRNRSRDPASLISPLSSFARTSGKVKQYNEGLACLDEAEELVRKFYGDAAPQLGVLQMHRASIYSSQKRFDEALTALDLADKYFSGPQRNAQHAQRGAIDNNRGYILFLAGNLQEAEPLILRSLSDSLTSKTHDPFGRATIHGTLARIQAAGKRSEQALRNLQASNSLIESQLKELEGAGSDQQKVAFLNKAAGKVELSLGILFRHLPEDAGIRQAVYETVLSRKGRAADLSKSIQQTASGTSHPLIQKRNRLVSEISSQALLQALGENPKSLSAVPSLQLDLEEVNRSLRLAGGKPLNDTAYTLENLASRLPDNTSYIDYIVYREVEDDRGALDEDERPWVCSAFVVNRDGTLVALHLGPIEPIEAEARALRSALTQTGNDNWKPPAQALYQRLITPLLPHIRDNQNWLISPDGILNLIPFSVFPDTEGVPLLHTRQITYVSSGRELLLKPRPPMDMSVVIIAAPTYTHPDSPDKAKLNFGPLPGTAAEARAIQSIIPQTTSHLNLQASESLVKSLRSPPVLHIATHGFFLDSAPAGPGSRGLKRIKVAGDPEKAAKTTGSGRLSFRLEESPLIHSGLAFAGANQLNGGHDENGVLTALEATQLNLADTRLVVLSACETGLGEVMNGEGVFGLRRAFQLAGAQAQILSLWKVDDNATATLMAHFYRNLSDRHGTADSLHRAARAIAGDTRYKHPNYWAAFILSGNGGAF